jgi:hypothetical protein
MAVVIGMWIFSKKILASVECFNSTLGTLIHRKIHAHN